MRARIPPTAKSLRGERHHQPSNLSQKLESRYARLVISMAIAGVNQLLPQNNNEAGIVLRRLLGAIRVLEYLDENSSPQASTENKHAPGKTISDNFDSVIVHVRAYATGGKIDDKCLRHHAPAPKSMIRTITSRRR